MLFIFLLIKNESLKKNKLCFVCKWNDKYIVTCTPSNRYKPPSFYTHDHAGYAIYNTIQIWTCNEGNMEFYGSEATVLTEVKPRSILLPKIHKTHIARHHRSIFALLYMSNVYGWCPLVYIARLSLIIYYHSLFYSMGAWCFYCDIILSYYDTRYHDSTSQQYQAVRDIWKEGHPARTR